jgi:hypothetical protein
LSAIALYVSDFLLLRNRDSEFAFGVPVEAGIAREIESENFLSLLLQNCSMNRAIVGVAETMDSNEKHVSVVVRYYSAPHRISSQSS